MWDDTCVLYGSYTIIMMVVDMEYDRPIVTNYNLVCFVEISSVIMITYDAN